MYKHLEKRERKMKSNFNRTDRKILFWMGLILVAFAVVIARLITGTWFGLLIGIGYALLWISPFASGFADMADNKQEDNLEAEIMHRDLEIARLRDELASAKLPGHDGSAS